MGYLLPTSMMRAVPVRVSALAGTMHSRASKANKAILIIGIFSEKRAELRRDLLVLQLLPGLRLPFPRQPLGFGNL